MQTVSGSLPRTSATPLVFVVDDDISVQESLELLIASAGWTPECFASAREFLSRPRPQVASCLLLDVNLPDLNGLDLQLAVAHDRSEMPIIFITGFGDIPTTVRAMKAGAAEFLTKPLEAGTLLRAIEQALDQSQRALENQNALGGLKDRYASLSPREREVMGLVVTGLLNKQVAGELGISEVTVKAHRGSMMKKMEAPSLPDLVKMAALLDLSGDAPATARRSPGRQGASPAPLQWKRTP